MAKLHVTDAAKSRIAAVGYDPMFGARPLKRVIQQQIENPLAQEILKGELPEGSGIRIDFDGDEFTFGSFDPSSSTVETVEVR